MGGGDGEELSMRSTGFMEHERVELLVVSSLRCSRLVGAAWPCTQDEHPATTPSVPREQPPRTYCDGGGWYKRARWRVHDVAAVRRCRADAESLERADWGATYWGKSGLES